MNPSLATGIRYCIKATFCEDFNLQRIPNYLDTFYFSKKEKSTSIFGREEMFPDTIERLVRPTCVRGHRVQGKSHRSFPTHQKTV